MAEETSEWNSLTAREIMRTEVITVPMDAPLSEVERLLSEYRIGGLPVTNDAGRIVGIVSIRDLIANYAESPDGRKPPTVSSFYNPVIDDEDMEACDTFEMPDDITDTAGDIMTPQVYTVPASASGTEVAGKMAEHNVHRILVTEHTHKVGLITAMDILRAVSGRLD